MRKRCIAFLAMICILQIALGQKISYNVAFPNLSHHEAQISLEVSNIPVRSTIFRMSRSSPGRYATHEFGKNIYEIKAFDQQGSPLMIHRIDGDVYEVPRHHGYIRVQYTLYANYADGTYAGIDPDGIHFNMPAAFLWVKGMDKTPVDIHFSIPDSLHWTIATQLQPTNDPWTFKARGLQYFMDCPTKIGNLHYRKWMVKNADGKAYEFRIALDGAEEDSVFNNFSGKVQKIVQQAQAVFGETPAYDYGTYTFLASINPYVQGDGMEHRNSTMISLPVAFHGEDWLLGVFAHEFFHCWNVKRIRPATLEPFDFEKSNMSHELWFAEGFTQYYGELLVLRSGIGSDTDYVSRTAAGLIKSRINNPGARFHSPVESSEMAVFVDAGVSVDKTNYPNIYTSYYPYGGAIALALDLELRQRYHKTLDDVMTAAWKKFGKPEIPYTIHGLEEVLAAVTGDAAFAKDYFKKYIYGHDAVDYSPLLAPAGFLIRKAAEGKAYAGNPSFQEKEGGLIITSNTIRGTSLYEAGLDIDDKLMALNGQPVTTIADLTKLLDGWKPGTTISVRYLHHGTEKTGSLVLQENPAWDIVTYEKAGLPVTAAILQFRKNWLGTK
jgi:predicted metalloprotease with PDZ domain